jgi:peptide/nickel transport system substrate-binding protein
MLQGTVLGGAGLAAAAVIGCDEEESGSTQQPSETGAAAADQPTRGGTLVYAYTSGDAPHQDPQLNSFAALHDEGPAIVYSRLMMWDLAKFPDQLLQIGDLAESVETPDPTTYVFKMRPNVKWQNIPPVNGRTVTAADAAFSLQRQIEGKTTASVISLVDRVEATDNATLRVMLKNPDADFLFGIADTRSKIVTPEAVAVNGDLKNGPAIGTSAWIMEDWVQEQMLSMNRNPDYWRQGLPYVDRYERPVILDVTTSQAAFRTGQTMNVPTNGQITKLLQQGVPDLQVFSDKLLSAYSYWPILVNPDKAPTSDVRVRKAISMIIDRQAIMQDVLFGSAWLNAGVFVPSLDWHLPDAEINEALKRDVQQAKQLLSAAGVVPGSWKPVLESGALSANADQIASLMVSNFRDADIDSTAKVIDKNEITERVYRQGDYDLYYGSHRASGGGTNGHLFLFFHSTGDDAKFGMDSLKDSELDRLIEQQAVILDDPERRKGILQQIMRRNIELAVNIPGHTPLSETAVSPKVANWKQFGAEPHRFEEIWLKA